MPSTVLLPDEEMAFQNWYADWATKSGIDPDPDHPESRYDYRGAWKAGAEPQDARFDRALMPAPTARSAKPAAPAPVPATTTKPGASLTPGVSPQTSRPANLVPLSEYLKRRPQPAVGSPTGEITPVEGMIQQGASQLLPKLQGPVQIPKGKRSTLTTMTDAAPVGTQHRTQMETAAPAFATTSPAIARPLEVETPREGATRSEVDRILDLLDGLLPEGEHA
jgi:hypothetical protein